MKIWKKLSHAEQDAIITKALNENVDYKHDVLLGVPASRLDSQVFYDQASFLAQAPLLRTYIQNPNHIGCHTRGDSELFFRGTQKIEQEVIELLCVDMFKAQPGSCDGYIASGGTEANIQALWIYRNYFIQEFGAVPSEISILSSSDTHYSIGKAANLLGLKGIVVPVDDVERCILRESLAQIIESAVGEGAKYFIAVANMGTTMFGSIDDPNVYVQELAARNLRYKLHIDGAFGGFIYPVSDPQSEINFTNPNISSFTLDAHKMLQAPYGTGIFLCRKDLIKYVCTAEASYVNGTDLTVSGSRSGASAVAVWMILQTYGPYGWLEKINKLMYRTDWCCTRLEQLGIPYFRDRRMNIITIPASHLPPLIASRYGLVPDTHQGAAAWYKIVVMDHVELHHLEDFICELKDDLTLYPASR